MNYYLATIIIKLCNESFAFREFLKEKDEKLLKMNNFLINSFDDIRKFLM